MATEKARTRRSVTLHITDSFMKLTSRLYPQDIKDIKLPTTTFPLLSSIHEPTPMTA